MPVPNYSVLKGDPVSGKIVSGNSPHYQIQVNTASGSFTVAVNIQSVDGSEVLYVIDNNFTAPNPAGLLALPTGLTPLPSTPGSPNPLALDFVRSKVNGQPMVQLNTMTLLPETTPAGDSKNTLNNAVVALLNQAIADKDGTIYAFGSSYADPGGVQGIHDIHMNQGNPGSFEKDNGVWQDGGIFIDLPASGTWTAVFIAFQTESWNTDNQTGDPL